MARSLGRRSRWVLAAVAIAVPACGDGDEEATTATEPPAGFSAERCLVRLHGKSETGAAPVAQDGFAELSPTGNDRAGEGHQWLYFPEDRYDEARAAVADALFCRGETFGGTLVGVVVDDPVTDEAVLGCAPGEGVEAALYWTGALDEVAAGADCREIGWTCAGGTIIGVDAYAGALGVEVQASPFTDHEWYRDAPELAAWLLESPAGG